MGDFSSELPKCYLFFLYLYCCHFYGSRIPFRLCWCGSAYSLYPNYLSDTCTFVCQKQSIFPKCRGFGSPDLVWGIFFKLTWPDVIGSTHYQRQRCVWHCQEAVMVFQQCLFSGTGLSGALGQWTEAGVCFLKAMKPQGPQPFSVIWKISWPSCQCQVFSLWILRKFSLNCTFFVLPQTHEALSAIRSNYIIGDRPCPEIWQTWKTGERTQR